MCSSDLGTTIAVLRKLVEQGRINPEETTVAYITGNGLKTTEAVASAIGEPFLIEAQLGSFNGAWGPLGGCRPGAGRWRRHCAPGR